MNLKLKICFKLNHIIIAKKIIHNYNTSMEKKEARAVNKELRMRGAVLKAVLPSYTKKKFVFFNKVTNALFKGNALTSMVEYKQIYIDREDGSKLRVCIYLPKTKYKNAIGLLWLHGGGYAMGAPEQDIVFIKEFMKKTNCVVISPDYTLSVEKPYPAAIDDCYLALKWLKNNASELGVNSSKLFVGGDSAGGGLTAALSILARDKGEVSIAFQMPLYPMLDPRQTESSKSNNAPVWNTKSNINAWKIYLGDLYGKDNIPKYASPAYETDYTNLPPTLTYVGDIEPFLDETINYAENLKKAGVPIQFKIFKGCFHGFDIVAGKTKIGKEAKCFLLEGFDYATKHFSKPQPK